MELKSKFEAYFSEVKANQKIIKGLPNIFDDSFLDPLYRLCNNIVPILADFYATIKKKDKDEVGEWFSWFVWECESGSSPMEARVGEKKFMVNSFDIFWDLMEELYGK